MIQEVITFLNTRIDALEYFKDIYCLAERIEREGKIYPVIYIGNEYKQINLDANGSLSYWRKTGNIRYNSQESPTTVGREYTTEIPLRLVVMMKKDVAHNDAYFAEKVSAELIGNLTTNSGALRQTLKAKNVIVSATQTFLDGRVLAKEEYDKIDFEPRYDWAYIGIDFNVNIVSNVNCFETLC